LKKLNAGSIVKDTGIFCHLSEMKKIVSLLFFLIVFVDGHAQQKVIHVLVALCDNKNQGIIPVPAKIGNGQEPADNLYWGCAYGVKSFLKAQSDWKLVRQINKVDACILERVVFKHTKADVYLVADAYDGAWIKEAINDFLNYSAGLNRQIIYVNSTELKIGGNSALICYIGHNGLMDFSLSSYPEGVDGERRDIAVFACASKPYFSAPVKQTGANPLIWTTHLMCPEAYTLTAMVDSWIKNEKPETIREKVAQAYNKYQKCGIRGARNLFVTGW